MKINLNKISIWVSFLLFISGIIDIVLRCEKIGIKNGMIEAVNDPGKVLFFILFLPTASYILIRYFPLDILIKGKKYIKILSYSIAVALFIIIVISTIQDARQGFCVRTPMPSHFANDKLAKSLYDIRMYLRHKVSIALDQEQYKEVPYLKDKMRYIDDKLEKNTPNKVYMNEVKNLFKETYSVEFEKNCSFIKYSSFRAKWAVFNTFQALLVIGLLIWTLIVHAISKIPLNSYQKDSLLIVLSLLTPWFFFRAYSEWYSNFGDEEFSTYTPFMPTIILSIMIFIMIFILQNKKKALAISSGIIGILSTLTAILSQVQTKWFNYIVLKFATLGLIDMLIIYFIIILFVGSAVIYLLDDTYQSKQKEE